MSKLPVILLLIGVSKQKLLFSSMIFYLRQAERFFHFLHDLLCNTIVDGSLVNLVIYLLLCFTTYCGIHCNAIIFCIKVQCNGIFEGNIVSTGYPNKLENYGNSKGWGAGGITCTPWNFYSRGLEGSQTKVPSVGGWTFFGTTQ